MGRSIGWHRHRGSNRVRPEDHRRDRRRRHRRGPFRADVGVKDGKIVEVRRRGPGDPPLRRRGRRDDRRHGQDRRPRLRRHPHPLRRPGQLGQPARAVAAARRDDGGRRQLRRGLRAGAAGPRGVADRADGGCRGHPGHRADRGHHVGLGELPGVPRRRSGSRTCRRLRQPDRPRRGARLRDGRARRPQRARHPRGHRRDGAAWSRRASRPGALGFSTSRTLGPPRHGRRAGARHVSPPRTNCSRSAGRWRPAGRRCSSWPRRAPRARTSSAPKKELEWMQRLGAEIDRPFVRA